MAKSQAPVESPWFNPRQGATYIGISICTFREMMADGRVPTYRINSRIVRVHRDDLDELMGRRVSA